jgi:uncharacterized protein YqeY
MYTKIRNQIKEAMISKDTIKRDVLKMVLDKAKAIVKEKNPVDTPDVIPDDIIIQAVQKEIKQLNQTKDALIGKESTDLYTETTSKINILSEYLPKMMSEEEVDKAVFGILSKGDYDNFGLKMKACMAELKGKADSKLIKQIVEKYK